MSEHYERAIELSHQIPERLADDPAMVQILAQTQQLESRLEDLEYLYVTGGLGSRGSWSTLLSRPVIQFEVEEGNVTAFELRCSSRYRRYEYTNQGTITIPESWGQCAVRIEGEPNSQVGLYQFKS